MLSIRITVSKIKCNVNEIGREMKLAFLGGLHGCREISGFHPEMYAPLDGKTRATKRQHSTDWYCVVVRCTVSLGVLSWWITDERGISDPKQGRKGWIKYLEVRRRTEFKVRLLF